MAGLVQYHDVDGSYAYHCHHFKRFLSNHERYKNVKQIKFARDQVTTGSAVEIEEKTGTTISNIGKTELTLVGAMSADDNDYDGDYLYVTYLDVDGNKYSARATINTTNSTTEAAFMKYDVDGTVTATAVTDCYAILAFSCSQAVKGGHTAGCGSTGALTLAVIQATATEAVEADLHGVGTVYGRYHTNHNNYDGAVQYMEYVTPWGEVKWAHCTTNTTDSTTEVVFYEATNDGDGTVTATATSVKDFYRKRWIHTTYDPDAGHTWLLTDAACANVDGSGGDVYAMIEEGNYYSIHSRYHCPKQHRAYLHHINVNGIMTTTNYITVAITFTPYNQLKETTINLTVGYMVEFEKIDYEIEPGTDVSFTVLDGAAAVTPNFEMEFVEAELKSASYGSTTGFYDYS